MNKQPMLISLALAAALIGGVANAAELTINFHPTRSVWSYPIESARSLNGVLVQNTAVINRGSMPTTVSAIEIETLHDGEVTTSVRLNAARLDEVAKWNGALLQSGMLQAVDFQFAPDTLLGRDTPLATSRTLAPGAALLLPHQYIAYRGPAEQVRVTVHAADMANPVTGALAIREGQAPGTFRFPLQGRWFIAAGATPHSHHRWVVAQEFALDILQIGEGGMTFSGDGTRMQDYHAYGATVLASADGEVVKTHDGQPDNVKMLRGADESHAAYQQRLRAGQDALLAAGPDAISGNHIVIRHADGVYSVYAHLKPGSLKVAVGTRVTAGQPIAQLGGSGNSTEPHLHFHLCDSAEALKCSGMPVGFDNIELPLSDNLRLLQTGDIVEVK